MAKRHGLFRLNDPTSPWGRVPWFLVGIRGILSALANHNFITDATSRKQAQALEFHFRDVIVRLAHSLDQFQSSIFRMESHFNKLSGEPDTVRPIAIQVNAGIAAESVMTYINMFVDDVARAIPFTLDCRVPRVDSFTDVKGLVKKGRYPAISSLFAELDRPGSWWELALKRGEGVRQRLVHYTDVIDFVGAKGETDERFHVESTVWSPLTGGDRIDFIGRLRGILYGLCDWLDQLEQVLTTHLAMKASADNVAWTPSAICPRQLVPIEYPIPGVREIPDDFLYLPLCDGSEPSKCEFRVTIEG